MVWLGRILKYQPPTLFILSVLLLAGSAIGGQTMRGVVPAEVKRLQPIGSLDASKRLNLAVGLPLRNRGALTNLLRDLYDPASPRYHHYLTAGQFADQFGPTAADYQALAAFARSHGLTVSATHPNRTLLDVNGTVADIEKALKLRLRVYHHPTDARTFFAPDAEPTLDMDVPVLGISGLDNFMLPRPMDLQSNTSVAAYSLTGSGPGSYYIGADFRAAYAPGVPLTGAGQSLGLFELDGYYPRGRHRLPGAGQIAQLAADKHIIGRFQWRARKRKRGGGAGH